MRKGAIFCAELSHDIRAIHDWLVVEQEEEKEERERGMEGAEEDLSIRPSST